ncbi:MAG: phenylalanine--tRNA ligase subunit alpha [Ignavibacteria bacterium]|nr:phenylalanine--tRNA ligase subunit alpha [Ignavibacteria bacterium]
MLNKINDAKTQYASDILHVKTPKDLEDLRIKYLGRNGLVSVLFEEFKTVTPEEKRVLGKELNFLRQELQSKFDDLKESIEKSAKLNAPKIDLTLPGRQTKAGSGHLVAETMMEIISIFKKIGFSVITGPEIESDKNNFEALNFPADHPARDMQDTFFINKDFVLRTHTTPVQVRIMENQQPPIRAIMPGRVYRNEAINARSYCMFHQVDGIYIDEKVTFAELKGTLVHFAREYYGSSVQYKFRPSFFPFTEPSAEMDITCFICGGKGCRVCKHSGWLEILGCGMVDPNVFKYVGYDPEKVTGYAFGMGIERISMLKHDINDIRLLYENDVRFLKQF